MKLTDQEQVVLKAIRSRGRVVVETSAVLRSVGYPKATTKKILASLADKGVVALHRHDYPSSLTPAERKLLIRRQDGRGQWHYFNAVSIREPNPRGKRVKRAASKKASKKKAAKKIGKHRNRTVIKAKRVVVLNRARRAKRNPSLPTPQSHAEYVAMYEEYSRLRVKHPKTAAETRRMKLLKSAMGRWEKSRPRAKNTKKAHPARRHNKAPHISEADISKLSPKAQEQLRAQLRKVEEREATATTPAQKKAAAKSRRSFLSRLGTRLRVLGQTKKFKVSARDLGQCKRKRVKVRGRHETDALAKAQSKLGRGYDDFKVGNPRKGKGKKRNCVTARSPRKSRRSQKCRSNPTPEETRKSFAGSVSGHRDLYFPQGTPHGLAKLGKLVSITTEEGTLKPVHGSAWLCADTKGQLHIGATSPSPLFDGPARNFGKVSKVEYEERKPHLGYKNPVIWFHHMGEEDGIKPTLRADGRGGLIFKGGAYRVTSRGIEN